MPRQRSEIGLQRVSINLFVNDITDLQRLYPRQGASSVIRALVRRHIDEKRGFAKGSGPVLPVELP